MHRNPRFFLPGVPAHVAQRGNNRQPILFDDLDYRAYLDWLKEASQR
jgi:REP element-mobilizing transposase RayT